MSALTRKTAQRGQHVRVTTRDNRPDLVGTLVGWGTNVLDVAPDERTADWRWKRHSVAVTAVTAVTTEQGSSK